MLPIKIFGNKKLQAIKYLLKIPSAQIKSGILLASLRTFGETIIIEKSSTRNHTELMLKAFKAKISIKKTARLQIIKIAGHKELTASRIEIPGDFSSAAFLKASHLVIRLPGFLLDLYSGHSFLLR